VTGWRDWNVSDIVWRENEIGNTVNSRREQHEKKPRNDRLT